MTNMEWLCVVALFGLVLRLRVIALGPFRLEFGGLERARKPLPSPSAALVTKPTKKLPARRRR